MTAPDLIKGLLKLLLGEDERINQWKTAYPDFPNGIWFRGEPEIDTPLTPGIHRLFEEKDEGPTGKPKYNLEDELQMFTEANLKLFGETRFIIDKLCIMQHHGLPTRLLDWTENILNALFFAVDSKSDKNSKLFLLDSRGLNRLVYDAPPQLRIFEPSNYQIALRANLVRSDHYIPAILCALDEMSEIERQNLLYWLKDECKETFRLIKVLQKTERAYYWDKKAFENFPDEMLPQIPEDQSFNKNTLFDEGGKLIDNLSSPVAFQPIYTHERMFTQQSTFTIHGGTVFRGSKKNNLSLNEPKTLIELDKSLQKKEKQKLLIEILIDQDKKSEIKKVLGYLGINKGSIYLDNDNQCKQIASKWLSNHN
jgi:hypothetical protein